ncbi:STAS domain-containing protein [Desulfovibrio inopinatus]|uniref:STAS domain-containing protein n=1 Tax=Desulfovibrio inopinatus TaxID=102109 RepID=UPI000423BBA3|nr:STAS domain-containing protein [Desulfovibrio inopinatus]
MHAQDILIDDVILLQLKDKSLDVSNAADFKTMGLEYIDSGHHNILLDISEVEFIDSSGLGVMVFLSKSVKKKGNFGVCSARPEVTKIIMLTRLDRVFHVFETVEQGLTAFGVSST